MIADSFLIGQRLIPLTYDLLDLLSFWACDSEARGSTQTNKQQQQKTQYGLF